MNLQPTTLFLRWERRHLVRQKIWITNRKQGREGSSRRVFDATLVNSGNYPVLLTETGFGVQALKVL